MLLAVLWLFGGLSLSSLCTGVSRIALVCICAAVHGGEPAAEIRVDPTARGRVNRRILGKNVLGHVYVAGVQSRGKQCSMQGSGFWDPRTHRPVAKMMQFLRDTGTATMRWPGGCGTHEFNWKKTVGPLEQRPNQAYGLPEFLRCCDAAGAEAVITLADFWGTPGDFADIVEYLNAPLGHNVNAGRDWAAVRAGDGHPGPYNVTWFECGNETYHGDHRGGFLTPAQYATRYRDVRRAMKAVDRRIKLGAVLDNGYSPHLRQWTREVIKRTSDVADFYIHHAYLPAYSADKPSGQAKSILPAHTLYALAFAAARQFDMYYTALNGFIWATAGRRVPLAVTEYNGSFVQGKPVPYRLCLGTAVQVADLIQVLLKSQHNIDNAQYWQFSNEYWGIIQGYEPAFDDPKYWKFSKEYWGTDNYKPPYLKRPAYYAYKLYADHLGEALLGVDVRCEGYDSKGGLAVLPASGHPTDFKILSDAVSPVEPAWQIVPVDGAQAMLEPNGVLCVNITTDRKLNYYHAFIRLPAEPNTGYRVTAEIRTSGIRGKWGARIDVHDGRGYDATHSWAGSEQVKGTDWTEVECLYSTLPDAKAIKILARRLASGVTEQEPCTFWIRNLTIRRFQPYNSGRVPYLAAIATRRSDRSVSVIVVNRDLQERVPARITGLGAGRAWAEALSGPSVDATNEVDSRACIIRPLPVEVRRGALHVELPPHSVAAVRVETP